MGIITVDAPRGSAVNFERWTAWDPNNVVSFTGDYIIYNKTSEDNPKDSRPYPSGALIENMTGLAEQWTQIRKHGYYTWDSHPYWYQTGRHHVRALCSDRVLVPCTTPHWETKLRLKIKDEAVNLGETLAEYRQTGSLFHELATKTMWGLRQLRKGRLPFNRNISLNDIASGHLTNVFGIQPLISDVKKSIDRLQNKLEGGATRRYSVSAENIETKNRFKIATGNYKNGRHKKSVKARAYVTFKENPRNFTLGNPLQLAWELTPFSWLIDYGLNVGNYLSSLDALQDVKTIKVVASHKSEYEHETDYETDREGTESTVFFNATFKRTSHSRQVLNTIPLGRITWEPSLTYGKVINALAVFKVITNGRF